MWTTCIYSEAASTLFVAQKLSDVGIRTTSRNVILILILYLLSFSLQYLPLILKCIPDFS